MPNARLTVAWNPTDVTMFRMNDPRSAHAVSFADSFEFSKKRPMIVRDSSKSRSLSTRREKILLIGSHLCDGSVWSDLDLSSIQRRTGQ